MIVFILLMLEAAYASVTVTVEGITATLVFDNGSVPLWSVMNDTGVIFRCAKSRYLTVKDVLLHLDTNNDRCLDNGELTTAFTQCLSWYERAGMTLGHAFGAVETPETTMAACDINLDGRICIDDVLMTQQTCEKYAAGAQFTSTCLCNCESINQLYHYVLHREPCT